MTDLLGGQIDLLCDQATTAVPQIQSHTVKAFAVTTSQRLSSLREVHRKECLLGLEVMIWNGAYSPKSTPKHVLQRWNEAIGKFVSGKTAGEIDARLARHRSTRGGAA